MKNKKIIPPIHPGEVLKTEFLEPFNMTPFNLSEKTGLEEKIIQDFIDKKIFFTDKMYGEINKFFGTRLKFWLNIQKQYDSDVALLKKRKNKNKIKSLKK